MGKRGLNIGDAIVICDAGGGTVDLISYEIVKLDPLELKELTACTGGLAGSLMLNKRFDEYIKDVVGERAHLELRETDAYRRAMKTFDENLKPGFKSKDDPEEFVTFPKAGLKDNTSRGLSSDTIAVSGMTLYGIFEPIFKEIDKLVNEQINAVRLRRLKDKHPDGYDIKAIFLVGGFGASQYLYESIQNAHPDVQVIQPNDAWSAIVRGAVMSQLPRKAKVTSSFADKHLGVAAHSEYEDIRDAGQEKHWDAFDEKYRCNTMTWYIHRGDDLYRARKIEFPFFRQYATLPTGSDLKTEEVLFECGQDHAPDHPKEGVTTEHVVFKADLSSVPKEQFKRRTKASHDGSLMEWYEVHYKLLVSIESGAPQFSIMCGGKEYGKVGAKY